LIQVKNFAEKQNVCAALIPAAKQFIFKYPMSNLGGLTLGITYLLTAFTPFASMITSCSFGKEKRG